MSNSYEDFTQTKKRFLRIFSLIFSVENKSSISVRQSKKLYISSISNSLVLVVVLSAIAFISMARN